LAKPLWLKTTYVKTFFSDLICRLYDRFAADHAISGNAILIISTDGLGDAFLRLQFISALVNAYRHNRPIYILTRPSSSSVYNMPGLDVIHYGDRFITNPFKRISLLRQLNKLEIEKVYVLNFICNDNLFFYIRSREFIGFAHRNNVTHDEHLTTCIPTCEYVGESLTKLCDATGLAGASMDNRSLLGDAMPREGAPILFAIGASNRSRMMHKDNMSRILQALLAHEPDRDIVLLGNGSSEEKYAADVCRFINSTRLINRVGQCSLDETILLVRACHTLIGFDSALYNLSFTLRRPTICLAADNHLVLHQVPWVAIVHGNGVPYGAQDAFGCDKTNSIRAEQVISAFDNLQS